MDLLVWILREHSEDFPAVSDQNLSDLTHCTATGIRENKRIEVREVFYYICENIIF